MACWWAGVQSSIPISQHGVDLLNSLLLSPIERTQSVAPWGGASCASPRNLLRSRSAGLDSAAPNPHDPCTSEHTCASERTDSVPPWLPPLQLPPLLPSIRACTGSRRERRRGSASPAPSISSLESPAAPPARRSRAAGASAGRLCRHVGDASCTSACLPAIPPWIWPATPWGARADLLRGAGAPGVRRRGVVARSICQLLPPFRFLGLNSKISPTKVDDEWWNTFCSLQKHLINALVFLKKYVYQCINCNACMHKVHALVNFLLILACNDLMHLGI